jgi:hypothetical protein
MMMTMPTSCKKKVTMEYSTECRTVSGDQF